ncbi:recombinase RecT [Gilliamella sp. B2776]|nr:recombinase RecT [Gilliamella sp. B2779]MCX8653902.1 recombinase RecT [Gilliamella sp. B2737]MCX8656544.1 recombinase RecT [Gilliamella sp. B2894]MCX8691743.1 recombinase RecT [Gilliamella sp. B2776]MCX8693144.1 recombinase RecT [Gilliamella sp. B2881]MCX8701230.1 recombinase RecT [Gilliamella sp. B2840]MCX8703016.1 recombinase RecT [Gilliamella sp. B2781]WDM18433.1 recombinase RecT [Gilliamella sp. B3022]
MNMTYELSMNNEIIEHEQPIGQVNNTVFSHQMLQRIQEFSQVMAKGVATVPKHLAGNVADCMAVTMQAVQWKMNPFAVAQKTHIVNGTLGYEAQLVNAVIVTSGAINGRFKYEYIGNWDAFQKTDKKHDDEIKLNLGIKVGAILTGEQNITWGEPLYLSNVTIRNSPLWKTAPKQQIAYLAVKYWARLYCPEVILGVYSTDELEEARKTVKDITPPDANLLINEADTANQTKNEEPQDKALEDRLSDYLSKVKETTLTTKLEKLIQAARNIFCDYPEFLSAAESAYIERLKEINEIPLPEA